MPLDTPTLRVYLPHADTHHTQHTHTHTHTQTRTHVHTHTPHTPTLSLPPVFDLRTEDRGGVA